MARYRALLAALLISTSMLPAIAQAQDVTASAADSAAAADPAAAGTTAPQTAPQADDATAGGNGEIVVTARKRAESVFDVPLTIAVLTPEKLAMLDVVNPNELNGAVPGLVMMPANGGIPAISFRGLGSNSALFSVESSVALFVDGVYYAHPRDFVTPIYDLGRIEMVKGTQGTLLGKNTTLGAITMVTNRPTDGFHYEVSSSYEFQTHTPRVQGFVNIPLTDTLQVRAAGIYSDDGGYIKNSPGEDQPKIRDLSGRLSALWKPAPGVDLTLIYQHDDRQGTGQDLQMIRDASAGPTVAARAALIGQTDFEARPDNRSEIGSQAFGTTAPAISDPYDTQISNRLNFIANVDLGGYTLTAQSAFTRWQRSTLYDLDFTRANLQGLYDEETNKQFSQELRIASPAGNAFNVMAGAFFFHNMWDAARTNFGSQPWSSYGSARSDYHQDDTAISLFTELGYKLNDKWSVSGGLRYTHEKKEGTIFRAQGTGTYGSSLPPIPLTTLTKNEDNVDGDIGIQFKPAEGRMIYVAASKGSKAGGFQNTPFSVAAMPYDGETAYTIELGSKFLFHRATLDFALFDTIVDGFQFSHAALVGTPPISQIVIDNSDVRSRGFEVNGTWRPIKGVRLTGGVVYADAVASKDSPAPPAVPVQAKGLVQPRAPRWSGNFDANYTRPITDDLTFDGTGSVEFSSKAYLQPDIGSTLDAPVRDAYARINVKLGIKSSGGWEIAVLGKNLTDRREPLFLTPVPGTGNGGNTSAYYGNLMRPRTISLQFTIHG